MRVVDRGFYTGRLAGVHVEMALAGVGPVNATETTTAALEHLRCPFAEVVVSGLAGSSANPFQFAVHRQLAGNNAAAATAAFLQSRQAGGRPT